VREDFTVFASLVGLFDKKGKIKSIEWMIGNDS